MGEADFLSEMSDGELLAMSGGYVPRMDKNPFDLEPEDPIQELKDILICW